MKIETRKFRIGELAHRLQVERFVIRFWEKEFAIKSTRSSGKQRFYDEKDFEKFSKIKTLLYNEGFTISGAKKQLSVKQPSSSMTVMASQKTTLDDKDQQIEKLSSQITHLQSQLLKLRELL